MPSGGGERAEREGKRKEERGEQRRKGDGRRGELEYSPLSLRRSRAYDYLPLILRPLFPSRPDRVGNDLLPVHSSLYQIHIRVGAPR